MRYGLRRAVRAYLRDGVYTLVDAYRRLSLPPDDRLVFCNSYPKSGTHLLDQILLAIPGWRRWDTIVSHQALSGLINTPHHLSVKLGAAPPYSIVRAHLPHSPEVLKALARRPYRRLFIYRDLRDVAVSNTKWQMREPRIHLHGIYTSALKTDDERLMASIVGIPADSPVGSNHSAPPIGQDFERWLGWLTDPSTLSIRFEDLVGARGGGSDERRQVVVRQILSHIGAPPDEALLAALSDSSRFDPHRSQTFSTGRIGSWREAFKPEHKEAMKRAAGPLLVRLGYESDESW
jgi:hypothetical protein